MSGAGAWQETVPRRHARLAVAGSGLAAAAVAAVVGAAALERSQDEAAQALNAACQDNQARAYAAAERARAEGATDAAATAAATEYVKEVRTTPECFDPQVEADAERASEAIKGGGRPRPEYPKYGD